MEHRSLPAPVARLCALALFGMVGGSLVSSNTINLIGGVLLPALVVGLARDSGEIDFDLAWLVGLAISIPFYYLLARRPGQPAPRLEELTSQLEPTGTSKG